MIWEISEAVDAGRRGCDPMRMARSAAQLLMERETRVRYGPVPHLLAGAAIEPGRSRIERDCFLLHTEGGLRYLYMRGEGITIDREGAVDAAEERLWLNGSVYAAVACINGLVPIHASAVAHGRRVFAFTGPSGAGKSTLVAGLGRRGLPMFCDDTLILDLSEPERIICLPGHKRLKLTAAAVELTGAEPAEPVGCDIDKFFAEPPAGDVAEPLPLAELLFLEAGEPARIEPLTASERFVRTDDEHYTAYLFAAARRFDRVEQFAHRARLARQLPMARFVRPWDIDRFDEGVGLAMRHVAGRSGERC